MADAVSYAVPNQKTPNGYYNIERMLRFSLRKGTKVKACGGCANARGLNSIPLIEGIDISTMEEFTNWLLIVINF